MKVAVIGEGFGGRVVAPVYRRLGFEVDLVSSRDADAVRRACAGPVDLVSIHSPPFLHREHVMCALDHRRAVLCEKPFGLDATEARAMRDAARAAGVLHFLDYEFRRHPARARLKQLLDEGAIGALQHVSWTFIGSGWRQRRFGWLFDAAQGGGWIGAYGCHAIDTLRWLFDSEVARCGGVSRIEAPFRLDAEGRAHASTAEDALTSWFVMENGGTVSFDSAFATPLMLANRLILTGDEGVMESLNDAAISVRRPGREEESFAFPPPPGDIHEPALIPWLTEVADALREGRQIAPSFEDGVAVAEAMERLRANLVHAGRSGAEGKTR